MSNLISNKPTMTKKEAIKWLNKNRPCISMTCNKENADNINIATDMAIEALENKRPQGEWIICNQDNEGIHKIECPFCKCVKGSDFGGLITLTFDRFPPFCENCGADMRGN